MTMQQALAESVVSKLEDNPDVESTRIERGSKGDVFVVASVYNKHCKRRVKPKLSAFPVYVELELTDEQ